MEGRAAGASASLPVEGVVAQASVLRTVSRRRRARLALSVSVAVTVVWAVYVTAAGQWDRVAANWVAALTMVFGSFVAGSTPQGGGAVAFPVFTKVLGIPSEVARTFSLCIQTVGMGTAAVAILITRRRVEWRAVLFGGAVAVVSFLAALNLVSDGARPFRPSILPDPYVRVTFTLVLAAMAFVVFLGTRIPIRTVHQTLPPMNGRLYTALLVAGVVGGLAAALVGSGADVLVYLFIVVLFGLDPKIGVPSSVLVMATVSVVGFLTLGVIDGQLSVTLDGSGQQVVAVGGQAVSHQPGAAAGATAFAPADPGLPAARYDLFGLWIAAAPVVAWGAPFGSWAAGRLRRRHLVYLVIALSLAELISTAALLDGLHRPGALLAYGVVGLAVTIGGLHLLARHSRRIFGLPAVEADRSMLREDLDVVPGYERHLLGPPADRSVVPADHNDARGEHGERDS